MMLGKRSILVARGFRGNRLVTWKRAPAFQGDGCGFFGRESGPPAGIGSVPRAGVSDLPAEG
jgi:hypothetical protein